MNSDFPYLPQSQAGAESVASVFDYIDDTVFFIKNSLCQYSHVNESLLKRCDYESKSEALGKTAEQVFPGELGKTFTAQDKQVIESCVPLRAELETHIQNNGKKGWCLTWKSPIFSIDSTVIGVAGISRDIKTNPDADSDFEKVAKAIRYIKSNLTKHLQIEELASISGLSSFQLDSRIRNLFQVSTGQYITQARMEYASAKLKNTDESIVAIAHGVGYTDSSAFTRQFRKMACTTPTAFRNKHRKQGKFNK